MKRLTQNSDKTNSPHQMGVSTILQIGDPMLGSLYEKSHYFGSLSVAPASGNASATPEHNFQDVIFSAMNVHDKEALAAEVARQTNCKVYIRSVDSSRALVLSVLSWK